jgi:hypothetical protein
MTEYLCIIRRNGVGSWARCATRKDALDGAARLFKADWASICGLSRGQQIEATLVDATGLGKVWFEGPNVYSGKGTAVPADRIERVTVKLP